MDKTMAVTKRGENKQLDELVVQVAGNRNSKIYSNSSNESIIPVLIINTFYDELLGRGVDGIDIKALLAQFQTEKQTCDGDDFKPLWYGAVALDNGKEIKKLNSSHISSGFRSNFPKAKRKVEESASIFGGNGRFQNITTGAQREIRGSCSDRDFAANSIFKLPAELWAVFNIELDTFEEKLWRKPGADLSDFFNHGLDEKGWQRYCKKMRPYSYGYPRQSGKMEGEIRRLIRESRCYERMEWGGDKMETKTKTDNVSKGAQRKKICTEGIVLKN